MTKEEKHIIKLNLNAAKKGKKLFASVVDDKIVKRAFNKDPKPLKAPYTQVILFPEDDEQLNYYGMIYLDEYLIRNNPFEVIVLTSNHYVVENISKYVKSNMKVQKISQQDCYNLIMYLRLMEFDRMIKVISLDQPLGRNGKKLLKSGKVDIELLVAVGIYRLIPYDKDDILCRG